MYIQELYNKHRRLNFNTATMFFELFQDRVVMLIARYMLS